MWQRIPIQSKLLLLAAVVLFIVLLVFLLSFFLAQQNQQPTPQALLSPTPVVVNTNFDQPARIISTSPEANAIQADYTGPVTISFNQPVSINDITISLSPTTAGLPTQTGTNQVSFTPTQNLLQTTEYTTTLSSADNRLFFTLPTGQTASSYTWSFTTDTPTGEEDFSEEDIQNFMQIREQADQAYEERKTQFPFITALPVITSQFRIDINDLDVIFITTYGQTPQETAGFQEVAREWLSDRGGNVDDLTIQYATS